MIKKVIARLRRLFRDLGSSSRIRNRLLLLLATLLVPILVSEVVIYASRFRELYRREIQANLEISRAVARVFAGFVGDVQRQEAAIGLAVSLSSALRPEQVRVILVRCQEMYPALREISWVHPSGRVMYSSRPVAEGMMIGDRAYFRRLAAGEDATVSDLLISRNSGDPIFTINRAVRNGTGALLGVMTAVVDPERMGGVLDIQLGPGGAVMLLDRTGRAVYRDPPVPWTWEERLVLDRYPRAREALQGREVSSSTERAVDEVGRLFSMVPVAPAGWVVGASREASQVVGPVLRGLSAHAGLLLLIIVLALVPAAVVAHSISSPLALLRQAVRERPERALDPGVLRGPREIRELAEAFVQMDRERTSQERSLEVHYQRVKVLASTMRSLARERSRSLERLGRLIDLSASILAESTPAGLLSRAAAGARELLEADFADAAQGPESGGPGDPRPEGGGKEAGAAETGPELRRLLGGRALLNLTGRRLPKPLSAAGWKSVLAARLAGPDGRAGGLLWAARRERPPFSGEDEALLAQLAAQVSLCLRNLESRDAALGRAAEAEEERRTLRTLMECVPEGIAIAEAPHGRVRLLSEHGRQMMGRPVPETAAVAPGRPSNGTAHPPAEPAAADDGGLGWVARGADGRTPVPAERFPLSRAIRSGETVVDEEWTLWRPDGTTLPVLCNASPIRDPSGRIRGGVVVFRDISSLRQAREQLEERVRERTAELHRANLELQSEVAERVRYQRRLRALAAELATTAERERQKLAAEVHDRIGQALSLSRIRLGLLHQRLSGDQAGELEGIGGLLEKTIQDVRGLIFELYPPVLNHAGLEPALQWLAERFRQRYGLEVELIDGKEAAGQEPAGRPADGLGQDLQALLFRSVQELLMNVVLHARTDRARVCLAREGGNVVIEVLDEGSGFQPEEAERSAGFGIFSIQEQLAPLGGSLRIESAPGRGTRAVLLAPAQ